MTDEQAKKLRELKAKIGEIKLELEDLTGDLERSGSIDDETDYSSLEDAAAHLDNAEDAIEEVLPAEKEQA